MIPSLRTGYPSDNYPKTEPVIPRVYHKYLREDNKRNLYGEDIADEAASNVVEIVVQPLTADQKEIIEEAGGEIIVEDEVIETEEENVEVDDEAEEE